MANQYPESALEEKSGVIRGVMENAKACTFRDEVGTVGNNWQSNLSYNLLV